MLKGRVKLDFQMDIQVAGFMLDMDRHSQIWSDKFTLRNSSSTLKRVKNSLKIGQKIYAES